MNRTDYDRIFFLYEKCKWLYHKKVSLEQLQEIVRIYGGEIKNVYITSSDK